MGRMTMTNAPITTPPAIVLTKGGHKHGCLHGHVWIYRNEIRTVVGAPEPGDIVEVLDAGEHFRGRAYYNPRSMISARLLSRRDIPIDDGFWRERLRQAISYRDEVMGNRPCRRLVNSESDRLPGLIVDRYHDHVVVQMTTLGIERRRELIVGFLQELLQPHTLIERTDLPVRELEGIPPRDNCVHGDPTTRLDITIGRARFPCDLLDAHKTGFYLDQQLNYERVAAHVRPGARVLDTFCHLGGFAIHAALSGAGDVIGIDSAADSVAGASAAATLSGANNCRFECANAFDYLRDQRTASALFDLIVLDPPTFARTRAELEGALRGYKEIHVRALRLLKPGGKLATFSCSHHVGENDFLRTILAAAEDTKTTLRLEERLSASQDHPVIPAIPETEYLKGYIFTVLEA
jgi:23S rRNA (cytosine1962-C5)-methyltransferase